MRARLIVGVVLCLLGAVWFGQGIGVIGGSFMSGEAFWAVVGALLLLVGGRLIAGSRSRVP
ncbi:MAG: hypothetical protein ACYDH6_02310 [Acidimicrobiales bacterium]